MTGYCFWAEMRSAGRPLVVTALVFGLAGGLALTAIAGARRTASAFPRLLASTETGDLLVNPDFGVFSELKYDQLLTLRGVDGGTYVGGVFLAPRGPDGTPELADSGVQIFASTDGTARDQPLVTAGRAPRADAAGEALISPSLADQLGVGVGDSIPMFAGDLTALEACDERGASECPEAFTPVTLRIVGFGRQPDEIADPSVETGRMLLGPAFLEAHPQAVAYWGGSLHFDGTVSTNALQEQIAALVPDEAIAFESTSGQLDRFQSSVRPQSVALALVGGLVGAAALLFAGLALTRQATGLAADRRHLRDLGAAPRTVVAVGAGHGGGAGVVGAITAVAIAVALSPLMPTGLAGGAEPDRGIRLDAPVLVAGVLLSIAILVAAGSVATWRSLRRTAGLGVRRPSRVAEMAAAAGGGPSTVMGFRFAFEGSRGEQAVPVRSTIATLTIAVAGTLAAATFGASLGHLLTTPSAYGANADASLDFGSDQFDESDGETTASETAAAAAEELAARPDIDGVSLFVFASVPIGGEAVPTLGLDLVTGGAHPTLVEGRAPTRDDEIVLAKHELERLGVSVGDQATVGGEPFLIVGRAVFPGYAEYQGQDPTDLGDGAWLTVAGLERLGTTFSGRTVLVDVADGADPRTVLADYQPEGLSDAGIEFNDARPSTVANLEHVRSMPLAVAGVLAALGGLAAAHALTTSVRRRRPELAVLRALGFDRGQLAATVAWQITGTALAALATGVPLGLVAGRATWSALITQLGGVVGPVVPVGLTVATIAGTVVLANLVATRPARQAARTHAGATLRVE